MKYWKTVVTTVVLTQGNDAPEYDDLAAVAGDIDDGDAVGSSTFKSTRVSATKMVSLLEECGSDASFFEDLSEER